MRYQVKFLVFYMFSGFLLFSHNLDFYFLNKISFSGTLCVVPWGAGNALGHPWHPQILADQLTLSQPGDRLCPPNYYWHTRIFRPLDVPALTGI